MATTRTRRKPTQIAAPNELSRDELLYLWTGHNLLDDAAAFHGASSRAIKKAWDAHWHQVLNDYVAQFPGYRPWAWWEFEPTEPRRTAYSAELGWTLQEPEYVYLSRLGLIDPKEEKAIDRAAYRPVLDDEAAYWDRAVRGAPESEWKPVSRWVALARKRNAADLERGHARGLWFDYQAADRVVQFFHVFVKHWQGAWAGKPFRLSTWQIYDVLYPIFGWKTLPMGVSAADAWELGPEERTEAEIYRRFKHAYMEVARKNGKSTLLAGVGLYLLCADREPGAQIFSAATKQEQAKIVWETATKITAKSSWLRDLLVLRRSTNSLCFDFQDSVYKPLSAEGHTQDGLHAHGNLIDEYHEHPTSEVLDVLETGTGARRQPLTWIITTAGARRDGPCWKERDYCTKVLEGHPDDSYFAYICSLNDVSQWDDETKWIEANPNLGISCYIGKLRDTAAKAKEMPSVLNDFLRKHCNIWTEQINYWLPMDKWDACGTDGDPREWRRAQLERLKGRPCVGALDLGATADLNAFVLVFQEDDGVIICIPWFWIPADNAALRSKNDRAPYVEAIRDGFIIGTEGNITEYSRVAADIVAICKEYAVAEIDVDPLFQGAQLCQQLGELGLKIVEFQQSDLNFAEPTRELEELVIAGKLHHGSNPVLRWMACNVVVRVNVNGNYRPDKKRSTEKIDGIVALIMGLGARKRIPKVLTPESWIALV